MLEYWKFVQYAAVLDDNRWLKRALVWNAGGGRRGRFFDLWDAPGTKFCRWQNIGEWHVAAQDKVLWLQYLPDFDFDFDFDPVCRAAAHLGHRK